jgi:hypothetical protein
MDKQILRLIFLEIHTRIYGKGKFIKSGENASLCYIWNIAGLVLI